jgi:CBS domain-containing protein
MSAKEFLTEASLRAEADPIELTIRELLTQWGVQRRGYRVVDRIKHDLRSHGLMTVPPFEEEWIDNRVTIVPRRRASQEDAPAAPDDAGAEAAAGAEDRPDVSLKVASLKSAAGPVVFVAPGQTLERAQSLMMRYDYSQLAVMSGTRTLKGAISWESIGKSAIQTHDGCLDHAIVPAVTVGIDDDLIARIPRIIRPVAE